MRSKFKPLFFLLFLIIALLAFFLTVILKSKVFTLDQMPLINNKTRLLVIAPHCDDEILGAFSLIDSVHKRQGRVQVVILTNGDASYSAAKYFKTKQLQPFNYIRFGEIRQNESRRALNLMGIPPSDIFFLTFPDKGLSSLWWRNWSAANPYTSSYTNSNLSPYPNSYHPKVTYSGVNLCRDLTRIINLFRPTIIVYPYPGERHPDHWAAYAFVKYVLEGSYNRKPRELLYLVHYNQFPEPLGLSLLAPLEPPVEITDTTWIKPTLPPSKVIQKRDLIYSFTTQMSYLPKFMLSFARKNELFGYYKPTTLFFPESDLILYEPPKKHSKAEPIPSGRIASLNLTYTKNYLNYRLNQQINLQLNIKNHLAPDLSYYLDITLFQKKSPPIRVAVVADQNRVRVIPAAASSRSPFLKKGGLHAFLSSGLNSVNCQIQVTGGLKSILAGGYIYQKDHRIDKTAWRVIKL